MYKYLLNKEICVCSRITSIDYSYCFVEEDPHNLVKFSLEKLQMSYITLSR